MANKNLKNASAQKNDEFYTQYNDIAEELKYYKKHFENKIVFCNCDDPKESKFWQYFETKFEDLKIKKLISTHYNKNGEPSYALIFNGEIDEEGNSKTQKINLKSNGDFRSDECIDYLKEADIVVTNPPFSLFREYVAQLMNYGKKFLIIGNLNAYSYKEIFKLIKENKIWAGATYFNGGAAYFVGDKSLYDPKKMSNPKNAYIKNDKLYWRVNGVRWFTNLDHEVRHKKTILLQDYDRNDYPNYENYVALNVDNVKKIPDITDEIIGVPISFIDKYCPDQFEIIDLGIVGSCEFTKNVKMEILDKEGNPTGKYTYNAKGTLYRKHLDTDTKPAAFKDCETNELYQSIYARILIKRKDLK